MTDGEAHPPLTFDKTALEIGPLTKITPGAIVTKTGRDRLSEFVLALALAFNDLKDFLVLLQLLRPAQRPPGEVTALAGQMSGMKLHLERLVMANINEMLVLIKEFADVATGPQVGSYMSNATPQVRRYWQALVATATGQSTGGSDKALAAILVKIRSSLASHYYQPRKLIEGYRKHFYLTELAPHNEWAYVSTGKNMNETRFYFADAAAQAATDLLVGEMGGRFGNRLSRHVGFANNAIEHILMEHMSRNQ